MLVFFCLSQPIKVLRKESGNELRHSTIFQFIKQFWFNASIWSHEARGFDTIMARISTVRIFFTFIGPKVWSLHWLVTHTWYLSWSPRTCPCKFFLAGVNFNRFNAKNWQFTVYFAVITQKKLAIYCVFCRSLCVFSV